MSAKRDKRIRWIARCRFKWARDEWLDCEPPRWRIFKYMKWKKAEPRYQPYEKRIKNIAKRRHIK